MYGFRSVGDEDEDAGLAIAVVVGVVLKLAFLDAVDINMQEQFVQAFNAAVAVFVFWMARWRNACWFVALAQMLPKGMMHATDGMIRYSALGNQGMWVSWRIVKTTSRWVFWVSWVGGCIWGI
jgi:hypothetical protein